VAKWVAEGVEVLYVLVTNGGSGAFTKDMTRGRLSEIRYVEQQEAADVLGVKEVIHLGFEDGYLYPDLELRKAVARVVRQRKPDVLISHDPTARTVANFYLNHPDHIAVGEVAMRAVNPDASSGLMFPELWHEEDLAPHLPKALFLGSFLEGTDYVDITDTIDKKMEALLKHRCQIEDPAGLEEWARARFGEIGASRGFGAAEAFRVFRLDEGP
jgi:LmbE family N-acetylglucosaminyl deacetylase